MKQKIGLIVGAGADSVHMIQTAKQLGVYTIGIDKNPDAKGLSLVDESIIQDIADKNIIETIVEEILPDFILPIPIGRCLCTTGYINDKFHLPGVGFQAANVSTDKLLFHQTLQKAGLRLINAFLLKDGIMDKKNIVIYPAVLKPRFGSGSRDVYFLRDENDLKMALKKIHCAKEDFILEQAVEGEEYSVDGAVINNEFVMTLLRKKVITPLPVRQPVSSFSVVLTEENEKLIFLVNKYVSQVVKELNYNNCLINIDLIINGDYIFAIEAAPRPSGHNLHSIFVPAATGIDMAQQFVHYLIGNSFDFLPKKVKSLQIKYFDFEDKEINEIPTFDFLLRQLGNRLIKWDCKINPGDYMNPITDGHSIMGRGFFIIEGENETDLTQQSNWIMKQFK